MRCIPLWLASLALAGGAFDDGEPWGALTVELTAAAPLAFRTADGAAIELDAVTLTVDRVALYPATAAADAFDPSTPPDGCTLCHGGHCHCGDALISYAELAARADGDAAPLLSLGARGETPLDEAPTPVPLDACATPCDTDRVTLGRAAVTLRALTVRGQSPNRDTPIELTVPLAVDLAATLTLPFDRDHDPRAHLTLTLRLPAELLDGVDLAAPAPDRIGENIAAHATLTATVDRDD